MFKIYMRDRISGLNNDHLQELRFDLIDEGMGGFSPLELFIRLDEHRSALESDILLDGCDLTGARAVETLGNKRFTFFYQDGDWLLETVELSKDRRFDGLMLTDFQREYADTELNSLLEEVA